MARPLGRCWCGSDSCGSEVMKSALGGGCTRTGALNSGMMTEVRICCGTESAKNRHFWKTYLIYLFSSYFSFFCSYLVPSYVCLTKLCVEKCDLLRLRAIAVRMCSRSTHLHLKSFLADSQTFGCSISGGYPFLLLGCSVPLICLPAGCLA